MGINRRRFIKYGCLASVGAAVGCFWGPALTFAAAARVPWRNKAMLNDTAKCIGCLSCVVACKKANKLSSPYEYSPETNAKTWTTVKLKKLGKDRVFKVKLQCMHCTTPSCVNICPTGAARKTEGGIVIIDQNICVGCKNCVVACPFHIPGFSEETGTVRKCEFCRGRLEEGFIPACAEACPAGAIQYGDREELLAQAAKRAGELIDLGFNRAQVYGVNQLDGLKVLYILPELPENLGLPPSPRPANEDSILKWAMGILAAGFVAAAPLREIFRERDEGKPVKSASVPGEEVKSHDI